MRVAEPLSSPRHLTKVLTSGENAAELPIQPPAILNLVLNLDVAKRLNLQIPSSLLALADQVIEQ